MVGKRHGDKYRRLLDIALRAIYRESSEVIHGTLYGALFGLGLNRPSNIQSPPELEEYRLATISEYLCLLGFAVSGMLDVLHLHAPMPSIVERSQVLVRKVGVWMGWGSKGEDLKEGGDSDSTEAQSEVPDA